MFGYSPRNVAMIRKNELLLFTTRFYNVDNFKSAKAYCKHFKSKNFDEYAEFMDANREVGRQFSDGI